MGVTGDPKEAWANIADAIEIYELPGDRYANSARTERAGASPTATSRPRRFADQLEITESLVVCPGLNWQLYIPYN